MQEFGLAKDKLLQRNSLEYILEFIYNPKKGDFIQHKFANSHPKH